MTKDNYEMKKKALAHAEQGFRILPLKTNSKIPFLSEWQKKATSNKNQINQWWTDNPSYNIGIATGNGLVVIDLDIKNGKDGLKELDEWQKKNKYLPETRKAKTAGSGIHLFYKVYKNIGNRTNILKGIDIKGDNGQVVAPGSSINGGTYEWLNDLSIAEADEAVYALIEGKPLDRRFVLPDVIESGTRDDTLYKYACSLQAKGIEDEEIYKMVHAVNTERCNPPFGCVTVDQKVSQALKNHKGTTFLITKVPTEILEQLNILQPHLKYGFNDKGNGELFADVYKNICRYNRTNKEWFIYDGSVWTEDTGGMIVSRYSKKLFDALLIYVSCMNDDLIKESYSKHVLKLGQYGYRKTMIDDAKDKYFISNDDLDNNLDLFNCKNGTMNLRTFEFKEHSPDDLLSKISNVVYNSTASSTAFEIFISEVLEEKIEKIEYLQKLLGYSLTGNTSEETCFILYGPSTRNGKSTLVDTIAYMMGNTKGYAMMIQPESLAKKRNVDSRQASGDIARLDGCRFLQMAEPAKRMIFDIALLKTLIGGDVITARHLHKSEFEFKPVFKLFINTNYLPVIADETVFTSKRINVITFDRHFESWEQDLTLKDRLKEDSNISGIYNWCLEGLKKYYIDGVVPPNIVVQSTDEYRTSSDKVGNFFNECFVKSDKNTTAKDVYKCYQYWCRSNGFEAENKSNFLTELKCKRLLSPTGTVNGKTEKNVVKGYETDFVEGYGEEIF